eukprot:m.7351 g.7351  ORF g.7351 m.7351 type:complete len:105 (-) comp5237_c0_seq2:1803-2117(-)
MFYSEYVFAKEGALGKFWLAAHWSKRLSRRQIADADVVHACDSIAQPKVKLALRTSGMLDARLVALVLDCVCMCMCVFSRALVALHNDLSTPYFAICSHYLCWV